VNDFSVRMSVNVLIITNGPMLVIEEAMHDSRR
jgi:hypothetical protein